MFLYEWKKMLVYRRGLWMIALLLLAELFGVLLFTKPYDRVLEENRSVYDRYLEQVDGSLTQDKRVYLEGEMLRLSTAHENLEKLKQQYYAGSLSDVEYRQRFDLLSPEAADYTGFSKLYNQYVYVREEENRSFLYTGGWEVLLTDHEPDYLYMLLLIFLLSPVFCQEYSTQMDKLILTQKKSGCGIWRIKVLAAVSVTVILTAVLQIYDVVYCAVRFGLPHWEYSLQSVMSFGGTQKELTLGQAFWLQFLVKEFGYIYTAILILFLSVCLKKYSLSLMAGIAILPLPFLTANSADAFMRIPGPWALTIGSGYLKGSIVHLNHQTGESILAFSEVTWRELQLVLVYSAIIAGLMLFMIWRNNSNRLRKALRGAKVAVVLCGVFLILTGCDSTKEAELCYNTHTSDSYVRGDFVVLSDMFNTFLIDTAAGKCFSFPPDAFTQETAFSTGSIYGVGDKLYYIKTTASSEGSGVSAQQQHVLMELDLCSLQEKAYYQWNTQNKWFFGLLDRESMEASPNMISDFFLHGDYLYYVDGADSGLYRMNCLTGASEAYLTRQNTANIAYDGQSIYYTDGYNRLVRQHIDSGKLTVYDEVTAYDFLLTPDGIYFLNFRDGRRLYFWDEAAGETVKISDTPGYSVYWDKDFLWLFTQDGHDLLRLDHDGGNELLIPGDITNWGAWTVPHNSRYLYWVDYETNQVYSVNKETLKCALLE